MRSRVVLLTTAVVAVLATMFIQYQVPARIRIDGLSAEVAGLFLRTDTEYAEGYSHVGFSHIEAGMSEQQVLEILGEPLIRWRPYGFRNTPFKEKAHYVGLTYSRSPSSTNYRLREVLLDRGVVAELRGYFYAD